MKRLFRWIALTAVAMLGIFVFGHPVYAADAVITFGSDSYTGETGTTFPVGLYIVTENGAGEYQVMMTYDNTKLRYVSGADAVDADNGVLAFVGSGGDTSIKYWLTFEPIEEGDASIAVISAAVAEPVTTDEEGNPTEPGLYNVTSMSKAPVSITRGVQEEQQEEEQQEEAGGEEEQHADQDEQGQAEEEDPEQVQDQQEEPEQEQDQNGEVEEQDPNNPEQDENEADQPEEREGRATTV